MILDKIKDNVINKEGKVIHFKYNGSRNQIEEFDGVIIKCYKYVFLIKLIDNGVVKSFSYSDILIGTLIINGQ